MRVICVLGGYGHGGDGVCPVGVVGPPAWPQRADEGGRVGVRNPASG